VPLETHGGETPSAEKEIKATLRPNQDDEENRLSVEVSGLRLGNQTIQKETERSAESGRENTHNKHQPPRPSPLPLILPKTLNHLRLLRREVHGVREVV
jgi:hypothetical protein